MNCPCTAVDDIRLKRKRFSISGSLLSLVLLLVLLVTQTSGRPSSTNSTTKDARPGMSINTGDIDDSIVDVTFDVGDDYADVDNVEWHHVKIVDGIMHEDHPIIMYKEDFVNEDYDPSQHKSNSAESKSNAQRKYKHLQRPHLNSSEETSKKEQREKYHALKPEKIYFDILPPTPVVVTDDSSINDSKFDPANIRVEVISLLNDGATGNKAQATSITNDQDDNKDDNGNNGEEPSKELLNKRPKKYNRRRLRRDTTEKDNREQHVIHKRHPHYIYQRVGSNSFDDYMKHSISFWGQKHPVPGKKWNGIDGDVPPAIEFDNRFGGEDNTDRVIWGVSRTIRPQNNNNRRPTSPPRQPQFPPLIHDSNPSNADFSPFTTRRPVQNNNAGRPVTTSRPRQPQFPPLIHNSNPEDADFSVFMRPSQRPSKPIQRPNQRQPTSSNSVPTGDSPPRRQQQDHRKSQRFGLASIPADKKASNYKLQNDIDEAESRQNPFDVSKHKPITELQTYNDTTHCEKATYTCCEMTELSSLYDCFHISKCTSSLAQIMSMCA